MNAMNIHKLEVLESGVVLKDGGPTKRRLTFSKFITFIKKK